MPYKFAFDLSGKTALVTGASRGIGRAIALGLAEAGAAVVVHGKTESRELLDVRDAIAAGGRDAQTLVFNLSNREQIGAALATLECPVDILVANASVETRENIHAVNLESASEQVDCNFLSLLEILRLLTPQMVDRGWGRIIGIGSIQEVHPNPDLAVYAALKAAQTHYLKTLAAQVAHQGVTVNILAPGAIHTDRNSAVLANDDFRRKVETKIPMGRIGSPQDCVGAAVFLASEQASYITGAWLPVDGGFHAG